MTPAMTPGIAWVTGAGTGIGRALAVRLAREGWQVAVSARTLSDLTRLARDTQSYRGTIHPFPLDVTHAHEVAATVRRIEADLGAIDLVVLNAGTYLRFGAKDFSSSAFRQQVEVNLMVWSMGWTHFSPACWRAGAVTSPWSRLWQVTAGCRRRPATARPRRLLSAFASLSCRSADPRE